MITVTLTIRVLDSWQFKYLFKEYLESVYLTRVIILGGHNRIKPSEKRDMQENCSLENLRQDFRATIFRARVCCFTLASPLGNIRSSRSL